MNSLSWKGICKLRNEKEKEGGLKGKSLSQKKKRGRRRILIPTYFSFVPVYHLQMPLKRKKGGKRSERRPKGGKEGKSLTGSQ